MSSPTQYNPGSTDTPLDPQLLEDLSPPQSLMERVALNQSLLQDAAQRKQRFVQDALLSNQPLQQQRLALAQLAGQQNLNAARAAADVAVTDSAYQAAHDDATWREANAADLAAARAELPGVLDAINAEADPFRLRDAAITFHGRYAHLAQDPVLGPQYAALDGRVAARLQARDEEFRARISTAAAGFRPYIDPAAPDQLAAIRIDPRYPLARLDPAFAQQMDDATRSSAILVPSISSNPNAPNPAPTTGYLTGVGDQLQRTGAMRLKYDEAVRKLQEVPRIPEVDAARKRLTNAFRENQTPYGQARTAEIVGDRAAEEELGYKRPKNNPGKSNPAVTAEGRLAKNLGRGMVAAAIALEAKSIVDAPEGRKSKPLWVQGGRLGGGLVGGEIGAEIGLPLGAPGVIIGAGLGGIGGSIIGEAGMRAVRDSLHRPLTPEESDAMLRSLQ